MRSLYQVGATLSMGLAAHAAEPLRPRRKAAEVATLGASDRDRSGYVPDPTPESDLLRSAFCLRIYACRYNGITQI